MSYHMFCSLQNKLGWTKLECWCIACQVKTGTVFCLALFRIIEGLQFAVDCIWRGNKRCFNHSVLASANSQRSFLGFLAYQSTSDFHCENYWVEEEDANYSRIQNKVVQLTWVSTYLKCPSREASERWYVKWNMLKLPPWTNRYDSFRVHCVGGVEMQGHRMNLWEYVCLFLFMNKNIKITSM